MTPFFYALSQLYLIYIVLIMVNTAEGGKHVMGLTNMHGHCYLASISTYNPPINFRVILLATLRHVVQIAGQLSRNNPRPI